MIVKYYFPIFFYALSKNTRKARGFLALQVFFYHSARV